MNNPADTRPPGFDVPGTGRGLIDAFRYRYLLALLVRKGTRTRYHGSILGWIWSYVKPAAQFVVFYVVLGIFLDLNRVENFAVYLFSGIIAINLFSEAFGNATRSIVNNAPLVKKIYLPRELFPLADVFIALVHFLPQLAILLVVLIAVGWVPSFAALGAALAGTLILVLLSTGLGLLFGALNVAFRDAENFVELILLFATWAAPVLYPFTLVQEQLPEWLFNLYMANPLTVAVELFHQAFWYTTTSMTAERPENLGLLFVLSLIGTLVLLVFAQFVFRRLEGRFAQDL